MSHPADVHAFTVAKTFVAAVIVLAGAAAQAQTLHVETFDLTAPAEVQAVVTARCAGCAASSS